MTLLSTLSCSDRNSGAQSSRAIAPTPADQAMARLVFSFHLDGLILWMSFALLVTLAVANSMSIKTTIANNIYNKIHYLAIITTCTYINALSIKL